MKIPVYFVPGLAASSTIFENISLPKDQFEMYFLEWFLPNNKETLQEYANRMTKEIKHENPVLIGVSFGGILVQEMAKHIKTRKVIIISSVKSNVEMPRRMKLAKATGIYKILPTSLLSNIEILSKVVLGKTVKGRIDLYEKYLKMRDKKYLDWALENVILWSQTEPNKNVIHIHGTADAVFPVKYIKNYIPIAGGTHVMIINRFRWLNENLPKLILEN